MILINMDGYLKAIKIRLYPNEEQEKYINSLLGSCRFVYNKLLEYKIKKYNTEKKNISFGELGKYLVNLKTLPETNWLNNAHSKVLQQSLINLDIAYKSFFKNGNGFPKFKSKKNNKQSCRFPVDAIGGVIGNRINIIKQLKNIHFKCSRRDETHLNKYQDKIKSGTLTKNKSGEYYFSILIEIPKITKKELPKETNEIGLDVGIRSFIVDSNNKHYANLKLIRTNEKRLKKLHISISRKKLNSNNRQKAVIKLAKFHQKLSNIKNFYLHQVSNEIIKDNQLICVENLDIKNMMQNGNLAKSIGELSLFTFKSILKYKCEWHDKTLIEVDKYFPSSKLCSNCGNKNEFLKLQDREWKCCNCGASHNRDFNAAKNILKEGRRLNLVGLSLPEFTLVDTKDNLVDETRKECKLLE